MTPLALLRSLVTRAASARAATPTLKQEFHSRRNSLNALRLIFAIFVLVGHGYHLGANRSAPHFGSYFISDVGVDGFFVISGYLIVHSRLRPATNTATFLRARFLRIYPGYWASLLICAFVVAPLLLWHAGRSVWQIFNTHDGAATFLLNNITLIGGQSGVADMPTHSPVPGSMNGSLWTLFYEFVAYLAVALVMYRGILRRLPSLAVVVFTFCWLAVLWAALDPQGLVAMTHSSQILPRGSRLFLMFACGALFRLYWSRIPMQPTIAFLALAVTLAAAPIGQPRLVSAPFFAYVVLYLGTRGGLRSVGRKTDLSYGVYLYAWPIEQALDAFRINRFGLPVYLGLTLVGSVAMACASYRFVEAPSLSLKDRPRRRVRLTRGPGAILTSADRSNTR